MDDEQFIPCIVEDGDEIFQNGIFEFNITKMIDFIHSNIHDFSVEYVSVEDFPREFSSINDDHVENVQIDKPVIVAEIAPGRYNLIDGNHRLEKARSMGIKKMKAYKIEAAQHIKFITSITAYKSYVEYWNSKL